MYVGKKKKNSLTWFKIIFPDIWPQYTFMHSTLLKLDIQAKAITIHCMLHTCQWLFYVLKMPFLAHCLLTLHAPIVLCRKKTEPQASFELKATQNSSAGNWTPIYFVKRFRPSWLLPFTSQEPTNISLCTDSCSRQLLVHVCRGSDEATLCFKTLSSFFFVDWNTTLYTWNPYSCVSLKNEKNIKITPLRRAKVDCLS